VFDHGYAGDTWGISDLVHIFNASTSNFAEGSEYQDWTGSCAIDMIVYERESDSIHGINKTETIKYQDSSPPVPTL
jgi:hypothetical protein